MHGTNDPAGTIVSIDPPSTGAIRAMAGVTPGKPATSSIARPRPSARGRLDVQIRSSSPLRSRSDDPVATRYLLSAVSTTPLSSGASHYDGSYAGPETGRGGDSPVSYHTVCARASRSTSGRTPSLEWRRSSLCNTQLSLHAFALLWHRRG